MANVDNSRQSERRAESVLMQAFARLDGSALGISLGILLGAAILLLTVVLLLRGGPDIGRNLSLLGQFFPGYTVTYSGALLGFVYGFITGFVFGWLAAALHNLILRIYLALIQLRENVSSITDYIDPDHSNPMQ